MIVKVIAYDDEYEQKAGNAIRIDEDWADRDLAEQLIARQVSKLLDVVFP